MLQLKHVTKSYSSGLFPKKIPAIQDLNLDIAKGDVFAFLGPNGAGKTTTIKLILNIIFPDSGEILIDGLPHSNKNSRRKIGYLPDQPYFYDYLTAKEYLAFTAQLYNLPRSEYTQRIPELLNLVGLKGKERLQLRKFSRGMLQRLGLAQALIHDPELLILDEPMTGLDPVGRKLFRDIILSLKDRGKTVFFSSHILSDAEVISDRIGILNRGRLVRQAILSELFDIKVDSVEITCRWKDSIPRAREDFPWTKMDRDHQSILFTKDEAEAEKAIRWVLKNKGNIVSVTPHRKSLEDIFMEELNH
ncbi:MAG: ABC transporter ATP-binding protein [Calditrichaeota bacterium]|nr:ABC transporter ATP-binding protein [Calditrichota bacterium]